MKQIENENDFDPVLCLRAPFLDLILRFIENESDVICFVSSFLSDLNR